MSTPLERRRVIAHVPLGKIATGRDPDVVLATQPIGSAVALALADGAARIGGILHFLLPSSVIDPQRAAARPGLFLDTGFEILLDDLDALGAVRANLVAYLVGGADPLQAGQANGAFQLGQRNAQAAIGLLSRAGMRLASSRVGGTRPRRLALEIATGQARISDATRTGGPRAPLD